MPTSRARLGLLTALFAGTFVALLDVSIVNVALPSIQADLDTDVAGAQWVVEAYTLCLAAFVLSAGALGDRYGRKRLFLGAIAGFVVGSAICALADSLAVLLAGRVIQGVAGAAVLPGALSLIAQVEPDAARRARLLGAWSAVNSLAIALGPVIGGGLVGTVGWEWIFLINVPIGLMVIVVGLRTLPESADPERAELDPVGQVLAVLTLGLLSFGIIEGGHTGWGTATLATLAAGLLAGAAFVAVELRRRHPMLPVRLFGEARFAIVNSAALALGFGSTGGAFFLVSLYLQQGRGHSALVTGLMLLPMTLAILPAAMAAGRITARDPRRSLLIGFSLSAVALLGMATLDADTPYLPMALLFVLAGAGMGFGILPATAAVLELVPRERSGSASATVNASRQLGTALGIAVLGNILAGHVEGVAPAAFPDAFASGMRDGMLVAAAVVLVATVLLVAMPARRGKAQAVGARALR